MGSIDDWNFDDWVETIHLEKEDKNSLRKWLVKNRVVTKDQLRGLTEQDMTTLPSIGTKISLRLAIIDLCNTGKYFT